MSGAVVWLTGLPSAGKSTLAVRLVARLRALHRPCALLDGDEVRRALVPSPDYSEAGRDSLYATLGRLAAMLAKQDDLVAVVAATAHRQAWRAQARAIAPRFIEVHLAVALAECRARDAKGLYASGAKGLPGLDLPYEAPRAAEVVALGGQDSRALDAIVHLLEASP
ncbi:MAG TPA: adenylyl-sulfate kinase [Myxococcales bacterium]|nr:adenylyl-sulfate kinase [Myxococcales bacterium]